MKKICKYFILEKRDSDLVGEVFLALKREEDGSVQSYSLVKVREELQEESVWKKLTELEEFLSRINHPNVLSFKDWGRCRDGAYLAVPCQRFVPLSAVFEKLKKKKLLFTLDIPLHTISQVLAGLSYLHSLSFNDNPLLHGLLTPSEIFLNPDGVPLIKHPGLHLVLRNRRETYKSLALEKSSFAAPEVSGKLKVMPQSDVYSTASILFYMLTGRIFPAGEDPEKVISSTSMQIEYEGKKEFPPELAKILIRALQPDPEKRYSSVDKFKSALDEFVLQEDISSTTFNVAYYLTTLFQEDFMKLEKKIKAEAEKIPVEIIEEEEVTTKEVPVVEEEKRKKRSPLPLIAGLVIVAAAAVVVAVLLTRKQPAPPAPPVQQPTISKEELERRMQEELQKRLAIIEEKIKKELEEKYKGETEKLKMELARRMEEARKQELERLKREEELKLKLQQAQQAQEAAEKKPEEKVAEKKAEEKPPQEKPAVEEKEPEKPVQPVKIAPRPIKEGDLVPYAQLDEKPRVIKKVAPRKPRKAIRLRISGRVLAMVLVSETGNVEDVKIIRATPKGYFEEEAIKTLMRWKFTPGKKNGVRVKTWVTIALNF